MFCEVNKQQVGLQQRAAAAAAAAASSLCAADSDHVRKVSQTHSSSECLRDCVMAAGGRVTQHEEWQTDSENKDWERKNLDNC